MEENSKIELQSKIVNERQSRAGNNIIKFCAILYGLYALFILVECIDFLALLHSPEPGYHATYDIVHVAFFIVELIFCASLTLGFLLLSNIKDKSPLTVIIVVMFFTVFRAGLIYYLYWQTDPQVHYIPYIYKKANDFSAVIRVTLLPLQVIGGVICVWIWTRTSQQLKAIK